MNDEITVKPLTREQQLEWEVAYLKELKEEVTKWLEEAEEELVMVKSISSISFEKHVQKM